MTVGSQAELFEETKSKKFTNEQIKEIVTARTGNLSWKIIKERWGVSPSRVNNWARSLGISFKNTLARTRRVKPPAPALDLNQGIPSKLFCWILMKYKQEGEFLSDAIRRYREEYGDDKRPRETYS